MTAMAQSSSTSSPPGSLLGIREDHNNGDRESEDAESLIVNRHVSIFTLYHGCLIKLDGFLAVLRGLQLEAKVEVEVQELCSRLQIWAGNHGAHRHHEDRLSLDYRLGEAPELHQEVRDHFNDLIRTLEEGIFPCLPFDLPFNVLI